MSNLTSKGQVTIPKNVRDHLGLEPGDAVRFRIVDGRVVVEPAESRRAWEAGKELFGRHSSGDSNRSTDRKRLIREKVHARRSR
jgi:RHH-type rel operon transcriptional repressor/antitoxin RelB